MYQGFQQNAFQQQMGSGNTISQYRGLETKYQPLGFVQSQYNQSVNPSISSQFQGSGSYGSSSFQNPQSYHTANYRGNQQGHDAYLRADSTQPSQSQFSGSSFSNQVPSYNSFNSFASQQQQSYGQQQSPQSFHAANYRGDQPNHDAYLRADSTQPSQSQFGMGMSNMNSYNTGISNQFASSSQQYGGGQFQSPQSYHTANYRGNQQGHDAYLRADSTQPSQSQFGAASANFNRYQF